jgi:PPOX class probable F420-dependent enzyme
MARQHPNMTARHRSLTAAERAVLQSPVFAHVAIVLPDGTPHVSAMWLDLDGDEVLLNTAEGRSKANSLAVGSPVAISTGPADNPYRNLTIKGRVSRILNEEEGAGAGINRLAKKYIGQDVYPFRTEGERRVQYQVQVEAVSGWGSD